MTLTLIDASVAAKWFLPEERDRNQAISVLEKIKHNPSAYAIPDLFYCEMLHVLCKIFSDSREIIEYLSTLQDLGMSVLHTGRKTLALAASLAKKHGLSGYDSIYAANAKLTQGLWLTADKKAHKKISSLKISQCLEKNTLVF